ncbi:MAG: hypothetical protein D6748_13640 [Calditrichaeota bacterium]|nr:MAG: hypothetical protein D6748_13640 [Calditrichota bacterium]
MKQTTITRFSKILFFLIASSLLWTNLLFSQPFNLSGYVKFFMHPNLNSPFPYDRLGTRLQLTIQKQLMDRANVFTSFDFNVEDTRSTGQFEERRSFTTEVYPVETYIDLYWRYLDLRVGKQFIFWGTTDWINPTDNINPWDYVNIAAEIEDYRIPVTAVKIDVYPSGNWIIEGVWIPRFSPHKIPIVVPDSLGPFPAEAAPPVIPENRLDNSELAVRVLSQLGNLDVSLSYYRGFDKNPSVLIIPEHDHQFLPIRMVFEPNYYPIHIFGGDFVTTYRKLTLKGEGAYYLTDDRRGTNVYVENPHLKYVLGGDYNVTDDFTLNLQFVHTHRFKYSREDEILRYQQLGNPNPDPPEQDTYSLSGRIQYHVGDYTSFQLTGVVNLEDRDFFLLPILSHDLADGLKGYIGATIFEGNRNSPFGRNKSYSRAFLELKYSF